MQINAGAATDIGKVREHNEDSLYCGRRVFVVADGLGGHAAGEVASALAVQQLAVLDDEPFESPEEAAEALEAAVHQANLAILRDAVAHPERAGMATTLTAGALVGDLLLLVHVGDSRAYLARGGALRQLTTDHTVAGEALQADAISPAQAAHHVARHTLTRAVGLEPDLAVDVLIPLPLRPGDRVLLCSDGLTEVVDERRITAILRGHESADAACRELIDAALAAGGPDNITVIVLAVDADAA